VLLVVEMVAKVLMEEEEEVVEVIILVVTGRNLAVGVVVEKDMMVFGALLEQSIIQEGKALTA
jgi:hypothetical protein